MAPGGAGAPALSSTLGSSAGRFCWRWAPLFYIDLYVHGTHLFIHIYFYVYICVYCISIKRRMHLELPPAGLVRETISLKAHDLIVLTAPEGEFFSARLF